MPHLGLPDWLPDGLPQIGTIISGSQIGSKMGLSIWALKEGSQRLAPRWGDQDWLADGVPQIGSQIEHPRLSPR